MNGRNPSPIARAAVAALAALALGACAGGAILETLLRGCPTRRAAGFRGSRRTSSWPAT